MNARHRLAFTALSAAFAVALLATPIASALTLTQTGTLTSSSDGVPAAHNLVSVQSIWAYDQFDASLGTLTAVTFSAHIVASGGSTELNPNSYVYTWSPSLEFKSAGSLVSGSAFSFFPYASQFSDGSNVVIAPGGRATYGHSFTRDMATSLTAPADLAGFTGLDDGHFWLDTGMWSSNGYGGVNITAVTTATLTYTYATLPLSTPSPAGAPDATGWTLVLFAPVTGVLILVRRWSCFT